MKRSCGWIGIAVLPLLAGLLLNCVSPCALAQSAPPVIRVGFYNNPPKIFRNEKGAITGFFPDILAAIADNEGWKIEYVPGTWAQCLDRLVSGEIDLMPDVAYSEERAAQFPLSQQTVLVNWGILYVHSGSPISAITDLAGKRIAVMRGSIYTDGEDGIRALLAGFGIDASFVETEDYKGAFQLVDARKVDAGVVNRLFGAWNERAYRVQKTGILFDSQQLRFAASPAFAYGEYVLARIDENVLQMKADPESIYYASLTETLAGGGPTKPPGSPSWVIALIATLLGLTVVVALAAVILLRRGWRIRFAQYAVRHEKLFNQAAVGINVEDLRTHRFIRVNKRFAQMLGYNEDELLALSSESLTYPGDSMLEDPRWQETHDGVEDSLVLEKRYVRRDRSVMWASVAFSFLRDKHGVAIYGISVVQDITDRKRLQKDLERHQQHLEQLVSDRTAALRQTRNELEDRVRERTQQLVKRTAALLASEERFRTLFLRAPDAYFLIDLEGIFLDGNLAAEKLAGAPKEQLVGKNYLKLALLSERDLKLAAQNLSENRLGKPTGPTQYTVRRADGTLVPVEVSTHPMTIDGKPSVLSIARDISTRVEATRKVKRALEVTIGALAATTERRDPYTAGHQRRVTDLACGIATKMGMNGQQLEGLRVASFMHDIGKIAIPAEILSKPGRLSENEFNLIKEHPRTAYDVLKDIDFPWPVAEIVLQHHERLDGSGYPQHLRGDEIMMEARILATADVVEAMSSHRPYRPALGVDAALAEINSKKGTSLDADVVDACTEIFSSGGFAFEDQSHPQGRSADVL